MPHVFWSERVNSYQGQLRVVEHPKTLFDCLLKQSWFAEGHRQIACFVSVYHIQCGMNAQKVPTLVKHDHTRCAPGVHISHFYTSDQQWSCSHLLMMLSSAMMQIWSQARGKWKGAVHFLMADVSHPGAQTGPNWQIPESSLNCIILKWTSYDPIFSFV